MVYGILLKIQFLKPAGALPTPDPIFVISSFILTPSKALAKSPGQ